MKCLVTPRLVALMTLLLGLAGCTHLARDADDDALLSTHPERFVLITLHSTDGEPAMRAGSSPRDYGPALQYGIAPGVRSTAREIASSYRLRPVREWPITQLRVHCIVYRMNAGDSQSDLLRRLRSDARVESAQPLNSFVTLGGVYNDPYARLQRSLDAMGVTQAHVWSRGKGVSIAVIDTPVDITHPDLARSRIDMRSFIGQRENTSAHGTAVTGIIAATDGNGVGIVGIAPEAQVHALAACWSQAADPTRAVCDSFTLAAALATAIDLKADIVNLSLGGPSDPLLRRLVEYGLARHMVFVAALPDRGAAVGFPSEITGVTVVDAVGHEHSARGVLQAPGTDVLTLVPNDGYDFVSGSSMAAANVSGSIALLLSHRLKADEVRDALAQTMNRGNSINVCLALAGPRASQCEPGTPAATQRAASDVRTGSQ